MPSKYKKRSVPRFRNLTREDFERILSFRRAFPEKWLSIVRSLSNEDLARYVSFFLDGKETPVKLLIRMDYQLARELKRRGMNHPLVVGPLPPKIIPPSPNTSLSDQTWGPISLKEFHAARRNVKKISPDELPEYATLPPEKLLEVAFEKLKEKDLEPHQISEALKEELPEIHKIIRGNRRFVNALRKMLFS